MCRNSIRQFRREAPCAGPWERASASGAEGRWILTDPEILEGYPVKFVEMRTLLCYYVYSD